MAAARPSASPRRARARRGEGPRLREEILAAATRLLAETGDEEAVSIRAVAEAVGVTPPSIYLHFADKTELIFAVCEEQFRQLDAEMAAAAAGVADPLEALRRRGQAYVRFGLRNAEAYRVLFMFKDHVPEGVDHERSWSTAWSPTTSRACCPDPPGDHPGVPDPPGPDLGLSPPRSARLPDGGRDPAA